MMEHVEKLIMTRLHKWVFCHDSCDDEQKDLALQKRIRLSVTYMPSPLKLICTIFISLPSPILKHLFIFVVLFNFSRSLNWVTPQMLSVPFPDKNTAITGDPFLPAITGDLLNQ